MLDTIGRPGSSRWGPLQKTRNEKTNTNFSRGRHLSYQRSRRTVHSKTSLVKIEGVDDQSAAKYASPYHLPQLRLHPEG